MKISLPISIIFSLTLFTTHAFAQISITQADIWKVGDTIPRAQDTMTSFLPGPDGANQVWDCSGATTHVHTTTKVILPSATPYASSYTTSNQAMTTNDSFYFYFNTNAMRVIATGSAGIGLLNGKVTAFNVALNPTLLTDTFPINYGNHFTDTYGYDAIVDGAAYSVYQLRLKHFGTVRDTITGWGTIKTNVGTYNCLKQKVVEHKIDSSFYKIFSFSGWTLASATNDTSISYSWLALETKLAVVELAFDSVGNPKTLTWSLIPPASTTGVSENDFASKVSLFPNPATNVLRVRLAEEAQSVSIRDIFGREIYFSSDVNREMDIDIRNLTAGVYFLRMKSESGSITKKFVKSDSN